MRAAPVLDRPADVHLAHLVVEADRAQARLRVAEIQRGALYKPYQKPRPEIVGTVVAPFSKGVIAMGERDFHPLSANFLLSHWLPSHWANYAEGKTKSTTAGASYVTGSHNLRVGYQYYWLRQLDQTIAAEPQLAYRFNRGVPNAVSYYLQLGIATGIGVLGLVLGDGLLAAQRRVDELLLGLVEERLVGDDGTKAVVARDVLRRISREDTGHAESGGRVDGHEIAVRVRAADDVDGVSRRCRVDRGLDRRQRFLMARGHHEEARIRRQVERPFRQAVVALVH